MNSFKRWAALVVALAGIAVFAAPAMASASVGMEQEGKALPLYSHVKVASEAVTLTSSKWSTIVCRTFEFEQELLVNGEMTPEHGSAFPYFETSPLVGGVGHWDVENCGLVAPKSVRLEVIGMRMTNATSGATPFVLVLKYGTLACTYASNSLQFTINPGTDELTISEGKLTGTPLAGCGTQFLSGTFHVLSGGKPVILH